MYPIDIAMRRSLGIGSAPRCCFSPSSPPPLSVRTPGGGVGVGSGACFSWSGEPVSLPVVVDAISGGSCEDCGLNTNNTRILNGNCCDDLWRQQMHASCFPAVGFIASQQLRSRISWHRGDYSQHMLWNDDAKMRRRACAGMILCLGASLRRQLRTRLPQSKEALGPFC